MRVVPVSGSEIRFVYADSALYFCTKSWCDVSKLVAERATRDTYMWKNDSIGLHIFKSVETDYHYSMVFNTITFSDGYWGPGVGGDLRWNGDITSAVQIGDDCWSVEVEMPLSMFEVDKIDKGDIWMLGTGWGRTAESLSAQWVPGHGSSSPQSAGLMVFQ